MSKFELKTKTSRRNAKQYYFVDGQEVPRVTDIIGQITSRELLNWYASKTPDEIKAIRSRALSTGSNLHELMETVLVSGYNQKMQQTPFGDVLEGFQQWITTNNVKPIKTEEYVWHEVNGNGYAGRTDAIVTVNDEIAILDYKTSTGNKAYDNHWIQVAAYGEAYKAMTGNMPSDYWVLVIEKKKDGTFALHPHQIEITKLPDYWRMFECLLEYYYLQKKVNK